MTKLWLMVRLIVALGVAGGLAIPTQAQEKADEQLGEQDTLQLAQTSMVQITDVRLEKTDAGLQVVLETADGELSTPTKTVSGNALIIEITNAVLTIEGFEQFEPAEGIAFVQVSTLSSNQAQVVITGTDAVPTADVRTDAAGLTLSVVPGIAQTGETDEPLRLVVTGDDDEGYNPSSASTATRTDTPLRDIPQSIQVVPQQVIEDRNIRNITEAVETVSGVIDGGDGATRIIRGFSQGFGNNAATFRNGYRDGGTVIIPVPVEVTERVEVLKGPASVLFGAIEPGGIINVITRQPLNEPFYEISFEAGNFGYYQPSIDLSGPLTTDDTALYRFIASYQQDINSFQDFVSTSQTVIAPSISLNFGERTNLNLYYEYINASGEPGNQRTALLSDGSLLPDDFYFGYPSLASLNVNTHRYGYEVEHEFNDQWRVRNHFSGIYQSVDVTDVFPTTIVNDRFAGGVQAFDVITEEEAYFAQVDLLGEFDTGPISHQFLIGFDLNRSDSDVEADFSGDLPPLDILDPDYDVTTPEFIPLIASDNPIQSYGIYIQDQISLSDSFQLLIGGRYDWVSSESEALNNEVDEPVQNDGAFSPRIGLVYQPSDTVSLYANYARSFLQTTGFNPDGEAFEPTRGTQYEVGIKTDFFDSRLSAVLAAYQITKTNVTTSDPVNTLFSIQTGEQRSRGIELDVAGEILPGWNVTASYAYTDAEVTEDNVTPVGNQLSNVPFNQASLWTTYEIQQGSLEGLGFGLGLFYIGERQGDLSNSFELDSYLRTDAALYYRRDRLNAAINIRNLFDIDYTSVSFGQTNIQRGTPFTIVGSLSWKF